jgi:hypothetical protein
VAIVKSEPLRLPEKIEQALIQGNLINLSAEERVCLVLATCKSLHLNPLTNPFIFILVSDWENDTERMILYASRKYSLSKSGKKMKYLWRARICAIAQAVRPRTSEQFQRSATAKKRAGIMS